MERRDFVKNAAIAAIGASLIGPFGSSAAPQITHLQVRYSKISRRWDMPATYYLKEINLGKDNAIKDKVLFIMIDTDSFLHEDKADYSATQITWLKNTLANTAADVKWKIVVGHHPCYTAGPRTNNYDTLTVRQAFTKIFNDYKVDVYLSGHDHSLQHLKPDNFVHQFISGAGSELTAVTPGVAGSRFQASESHK